MSERSSSSSSSGIGFPGLLTIVFIVMKLTGYIDWPWVWVVSPIWISLLIIFAMLAVFGLAGLGVWLAIFASEKWRDGKPLRDAKRAIKANNVRLRNGK